ncbi:MAG: aminotransferase class III-fold pyridoxal phosphate-dependent enzyme [Actinobacteria bacterium]|nr:aminotransferase class III-fold pyridoxal phosphate-dependent enzyme [Actinomycetota bacterium]
MSDHASLREAAKRHLWPIFGRGDTYFDDPSTSPIITGGSGSYVIDIEGRKYLDATGAQATSSLGYGNAAVAKAIAGAVGTFQANPSTFLPHEPAIRLAEKISGLAPPGFNKVFFAVNGTDANETAIRIARQYFRIKGEAAKRQVVARWKGYHGTSAITSAASGNTERRQFATPLPDGFLHIEPPYLYREPGNLDPEGYGGRSAAQLTTLIERHHASNIGAFIAEPTMGGGGVFPGPSGYWRAIREICNEAGMLLIFDEVITAFGRTGHWFESELIEQEEGILPDIITFGKGVTAGFYPLAGVIVADHIYQAFETSGAYLNHGYTFGATPLGCITALATIDTLERDGVVASIPDKAALLGKLLRELKESSAVIGDLRERGLMFGVEIVPNNIHTDRFRNEAAARSFLIAEGLRNGLLMVVSGNTINVIPPMTISNDEIHELVTKLEAVLAAVELGIAAGELS